MRRPLTLALSLAASSLLMSPVASAYDAEATAEPAEACPAPEVSYHYDETGFFADATLQASGCAAREQRMFPLWLEVIRYDETTAHGVTQGVLCGPFRASTGTDGPTYSCDVGSGLDHPGMEEAWYAVEVTFPAADGEDTVALELLCASDDAGAGCVDPDQVDPAVPNAG